MVVLEPSLFVSRRAIAAPRLWAAFVDPCVSGGLGCVPAGREGGVGG